MAKKENYNLEPVASGRSASNGLEQTVEALLFVYGEPLKIKKICQVTGENPKNVTVALNNLKMSLTGRGVKLINHQDDWQLVAEKTASEFIEKLVKNEIQEELTPAGLEVLAVTAYHGPATKAQIESIRGVNSAYVLRNLALRGLVEKIADKTDRKNKYQISLTALRKLGLEKREELPMFNQLKQDLIKTENILNQ